MSIDQSSTVLRAVAELYPSTSYNGDDHDTSLESLCRACGKIDWSNITDLAKFKGTESSTLFSSEQFAIPIRAFKKTYRSQLLDSNCRICRLVGSLVNPQSGCRSLDKGQKLSDQPLDVYLEVYKGSSEAWGYEKSAPYVKLAVRSYLTGPKPKYYDYDEHGDHLRFIIAHKSRNNENVGIRKLEPLIVNFDFLRQTLNKCLEDHESCRSTRVEIARFRVIEVASKRVCQAPQNCEYIALSYVWGDNSACKSTQGEFPAVIEDAFTVTEALGYRYLWVDRYCIDQDPNSPHVQSMINQMHLVYSNASVTIVAASSSSASDGLSGISVPRYQAHAKIGETHLIGVPNVEADILLSKWSTRGWTYQEWYFSRRRLVFTDSEVIFFCNDGKAKERDSDHDFYVLGLEAQKYYFQHPYPRFGIRLLKSQIEIYSRRDLSHDCDSLNAFAGILRHHESDISSYIDPLYHLWGVPLHQPDYSERQFVEFDLIWNHEAIAHRRDGLPSWSWSGWGGSVTFDVIGLNFKTHILELAASKPLDDSKDENEGVTSAVERIFRIQIPLEDRTIDLDNLCRERQLNLHREIYSKELHITSFIVPLRFRKVRGYHPGKKIAGLLPPESMPTFLLGPGMFLGVPVSFDREYNFELHKLGLVLPNYGHFSESCTYNIIVLHPTADGKYERGGIFTLYYDNNTGRLEGREPCGGPGVLLDENDHLISYVDSKYQEWWRGAPNEHPFLKSAEWKTICLV